MIPAIVFNNVDLPEPLGPTRAISSPYLPSVEILRITSQGP